MISPEIKVLLERANESHEAAKVLINGGFARFSVAQSYYTMFYLVGAILYSKGLRFSSHSALAAAYGKEFAKTGVLDPKFHRYLLVTQKRRETGHYGVEKNITDEEARESYQWAEEFMETVKKYLGA